MSMKRSKTLHNLPPKKLAAGLNKLQKAGITPALWLQMLDTSSYGLDRIAEAWTRATRQLLFPFPRGAGIAYDAAAVSHILGIRIENKVPHPQPAYGEIVVYYGGWTLQELRACPAGEKHMFDLNELDCSKWRADSGYYRLLLPVPRSNLKNQHKQLIQLGQIDRDWQPAPVVVAATALLVHMASTGDDLLGDHFCRCAETLPNGNCAELVVRNDCIDVCSYPACKAYVRVYLAAARKVV